MRGIHLSWHPGPDPRQQPLAWDALCGVTLETIDPSLDPLLGEINKGYTITPDVSMVNCANCMVIYWSGEYTGFLSEKTPKGH